MDEAPLQRRLWQTLKSRRMLVALSALGVGLLLMAVPELAPVRGELLVLVITLALVLIGGYRVDDATGLAGDRRAWNGATADIAHEALRGLIKQVLLEVIEGAGAGDSAETLAERASERLTEEMNNHGT